MTYIRHTKKVNERLTKGKNKFIEELRSKKLCDRTISCRFRDSLFMFRRSIFILRLRIKGFTKLFFVSYKLFACFVSKISFSKGMLNISGILPDYHGHKMRNRLFPILQLQTMVLILDSSSEHVALFFEK